MKIRLSKSLWTWAGAVILGLTMGCATEHVIASGKQYSATNPAKIVIYHTQKPKKPFEELGRVAVDKYNNFAISRSGEEINKLLKEKAASIGGDAVISVTEDFASVSGVVIRSK
jgi:hypothetical protein